MGQEVEFSRYEEVLQMKMSRFTDSQIVDALKRLEARLGVPELTPCQSPPPGNNLRVGRALRQWQEHHRHSLPRLYELTSGRIQIDGIAIRKIRLSCLKNKLQRSHRISNS